MPHVRPEISQWLQEKGYTTEQIEKILDELDNFDDHAYRESLFDDLATGAFDIRPIIEAALKDE